MQHPVALITGATGAIGQAIATRLAQDGYALILHCRMSSRQLAADMAEQLGVPTKVVTADLSASQDIGDLFAASMAAFGRLDVLVNNAGINKDQLLLRMREEDFDQVLNVNLKAAFLCTQQAAKIMMRQRQGRIVNIVSIAGQIGTFGQANYAASKAGLIALTKTTARELAARGIAVNAVAPGFIQGGLTEGLTAEQKTAYVAQIPLGRPGLPEEVAHAVAFLADKRSVYITGQVLAVNGGLLM